MTNEERESLHELYPHVSEKEREEVYRRLDEYLVLILRIYERINQDPAEYKRFKKLLVRARRNSN